jgi:hypothetical protein
MEKNFRLLSYLPQDAHVAKSHENATVLPVKIKAAANSFPSCLSTTTTIMSSTTTTSESQKAPEITVLNRVISIPLVQSSLEKVNGTLSTNPYTRSPYSTAKGLSEAAFKLSEPLQCSIAPIIVRVDGYANKAVDMVESRYPYPFKATPEEVYNSIHEIQQQYADYATRTYDERVRNPALHVAQGIDKVCLLLSMRAFLVLMIHINRVSHRSSMFSKKLLTSLIRTQTLLRQSPVAKQNTNINVLTTSPSFFETSSRFTRTSNLRSCRTIRLWCKHPLTSATLDFH